MIKEAPTGRVCANCGTDYTDHTKGKHMHIAMKDQIETEDMPPLRFTKGKYKITLCPSCSEYLDEKINQGKLVPIDDLEFNEGEIQSKRLIDFGLAHDAFFHCKQQGAFVSLIKGRSKQYTWEREFKEKKNIGGKLHFNLWYESGVNPGDILEIGGKRGKVQIRRFILVVSIEKKHIYYYPIDEEKVTMVFPLEEGLPTKKPTFEDFIQELKN